MIKENDFRLPIKHLGSGALQALYIITSIVCSKSKILCLEELEQNLSPRKQYEILKKVQAMIEETGLSLNQLIISSHSAVYSKPKLGLIYFLEKNDGKSTINQFKLDNEGLYDTNRKAVLQKINRNKPIFKKLGRSRQ